MSPSNVLKFPTQQSSDWPLKIFAVVFYMVIAYGVIKVAGLTENGFFFLFLWGLLYHFFVRQRLYRSNYFAQNKIILALLAVLFLWAYPLFVILMVGVCLLYRLLVYRDGKEPPYFLRFHLLTALIGHFFLLAAYLLINAGMNLIFAILSFLPISLAGLFDVMAWSQLIFLGMLALFTVWLSLNALMGRTPYLPLVTDNVRHLA